MVTTPNGAKRQHDFDAPEPSIASWRRKSSFRNPYAKPRRGPRLRDVTIFLSLMLLLLVVDGIYVVTSIQEPLRDAARSLDEGVDALLEGNVPAARESFEGAEEKARKAEELSSRPSLFLASHIPWLSGDADAIRTLTRSGRLFAAAGTSATDAVEILGGTSRDEIASALYNRGRLQFQTIGEAQIALGAVAENLTEARTLLETAPLPRIQRLGEAIETARTRIIEVEPRAAAGARLLDALPRMMGRDEVRRYFVALQSQSEARATGGSIGLYGVMEADRGRIRMVHVGPSSELGEHPSRPLTSGILLPAWYAERYGDDVNLGNVNRSPHFPLAARTILQLYRNATGTSLDGVWSFDPIAFQDVAAATGPLSGPGYDVALGPDNAAEVLLRDVYLHFGTRWEDQTRFLIGIIQDLYARLGSRQADTASLFEGLAEAAGGSHFKIFSADPEEQRTLVDLGVDGGLALDDPASQMIFHNNIEGNKVDFFLQRRIETSISLTADGGAEVATTVKLENEAPPGPPSILLGFPQRGERPGFNHMELNVLLPREAKNVAGQIENRSTRLRLGREGSFPLASIDVELPPGSSRQVTIEYSVEDIQRFVEGGRDFRFVLLPQPTAIPDHYVVTVTAPSGYSLARAASSGASRVGESLRFSGELEVPTTVRARVVRG